jgi:hypothetical protein
VRWPRRTLSAVAAVVAFLALSGEGCHVTFTYGTQWQGDASACATVTADAVIQTIGGDTGGLSQEFGKVTPPDYPGHEGCYRAFVLDYLMPTPGTNVNPGWDWAWMHVASRMPGIDASKCLDMWTSLRVYAYWTYNGVPQQKMILETYRKGKPAGDTCDFGLPDNVWMSSAYVRVRAASQHGWALAQTQPHYSYFVTNNH